VRTTAKADYAVRAAIELAAAGGLVNAEQIAEAQQLPPQARRHLFQSN
jgi:DNA-binding IscR family transcriptional regulator